MSASKRKEEYLQYIGSEAWGDVRDRIMKIAEGICEWCEQPAQHVHHIKYPKNIGGEDPRYLAALCKWHHELAHGKTSMVTLNNPRIVDLEGFGGRGRKFHSLIGEDGVIWATCKNWGNQIRFPSGQYEYLQHLFVKERHERENRGDYSHHTEHEGSSVYRWALVSGALRIFEAQFRYNEFRGSHAEMSEFNERMRDIRAWGDDQQEKAIAQLVRGRVAPATTSMDAGEFSKIMADGLIEFAREIAKPLREHSAAIGRHDLVITEIEARAPFMRQSDENIDIKQGCMEIGYPPEFLVKPGSAETLAAMAGRLLKLEGAKTGPIRLTRLDGCKLIREVNTYRRDVVYAMLRSLMETNQKHS